MYSRMDHPKWWQVYLILPLLIALFALDSRLKISVRGHQVVQIGIVLLICLLTHLWVRANADTFSRIDREEQKGSVRVIRVAASQFPGPDGQNGRILQLPNSEIKGVLGNTFEMDYIDTVSSMVEDIAES